MANAQVNIGISARDEASRKIAGVTKSLGGLSSKAVAVGSAIGTALGGLAVKGLGMLTDFVSGSIGAASNLNETMSKTKTIFGDASDDVIAFAKTAGDSLGLSQQAALDASSTFAIFAQSAGLSGKDLSSFSGDLVTLSADFASFYNTSPEQAITAIGAALRGESEPIRKYNILLNDATLRQRAMSLGIIKNTKHALTPQQKVLAAQAEIMAQSTVAQGDFTKTSGGLANQQRILSAAMANLSSDLGTAFMPILQEVMGFITGVVIPTFRNNFVPIIGKLKETITKVTDTLKAAFGPAIETLKPIIDSLSERFGVLVWWAQYRLLPAALAVVSAFNGPLGTALLVVTAGVLGAVAAFKAIKFATAMWTAATKAWVALQAIASTALAIWNGQLTLTTAVSGATTGAMGLLNTVLAMNPIGLVVIGIAALIAALVIAYNTIEPFRKIVDKLFKVLSDIAGFIVNVLVGAFKILSDFLASVGDEILKGPFGFLLQMILDVAGGIGNIIGSIFGGDKGPATVNTGITSTGGGGGTRYLGGGVDGGAPVTNVNVTLDGKKIAKAVDTRLGASTRLPRSMPGGGL